VDRAKHVKRHLAVEKARLNNAGGQLTGPVLHFWGVILFSFWLWKLVVTWWLPCIVQMSRHIQGHPEMPHV